MRFKRSAAILIGAMLALTACGDEEGPSTSGGGGNQAEETAAFDDNATAEQVLAKAKEAAKSATSVHILGNFEESGSSLKVDMVISDEAGADGTLKQNGDEVAVRLVDGSLYVKSDSFAQSVGAKEAKGKWLKAKPDDARMEQFTGLTSMDSAFDDMLSPDGKMKKVEGKDVDGTPTVGLDDGSDEDSGILYIAAKGPAYPLLIEPKKGPGSFQFTEWNEKVEIAVPASDQVIDLAKLAK